MQRSDVTFHVSSTMGDVSAVVVSGHFSVLTEADAEAWTEVEPGAGAQAEAGAGAEAEAEAETEIEVEVCCRIRRFRPTVRDSVEVSVSSVCDCPLIVV